MSFYWSMPVGRDVVFYESQSVSREFSTKKEKKKIKERRKRYEPYRAKKQKIHLKYKSTRPLDSRYSNQHKLRRMYRNS